MIELIDDCPTGVPGAPTRPVPMMSRALVLTFVANFGALTSFFLLVSVVPMYASAQGVGEGSVGFATGSMMFATVIGEFATPTITKRFGWRAVLTVGLVLLGAPVLAMPAAHSLAMLVAICVVRGLGFALVAVVGGTLVAILVPPTRRAEGLGLYGIVAGVPAVVALPLGVWLISTVGYPTVFVLGGVTALGGLVAVAALEPSISYPQEAMGLTSGLHSAGLLRPALVFTVMAMAAGIVVTFLPLAMAHASGGVAVAALFTQAVASTVSRWWAGRCSARYGNTRLLTAGVLASGAGLLGLVVIANPLSVLVGMLVFGAGFGVAQNASLDLMYSRVETSRYATVSALWNLAYDTGYGIGAVWFGVLATRLSYPVAFAVTAALVLAVATKSTE